MSLVLDAGIVVKWFVEEERSTEASALLGRPHGFIAPETLVGNGRSGDDALLLPNA